MILRDTLTPEEQRAYEKLPVPFCVFLIRGESFTLLALSDGFCESFHARREDFSAPLIEVLRRCVHPDDLPKLRADLESACLKPDGRFASLCRFAAQGENYRWLSGRGSVRRQSDGSYLLYAAFSDVHNETELQREAAANRRRQDVLLSDILSTTKAAIFWKDADRRFLGANRAFLDYYGFRDESDIVGKNDEDMGWHTQPDPYRNDEERILREGVSTYRVRGKCMARGENRDIVASKSPLIVDGKIVGLVGSFEDVTRETRQRAEIERLNTELEAQISDRDLLMSISEVCIVKIDLATFTFLEYNDAMCRMIGCTREQYERLYHRDMAVFFTGEYRGELDSLKTAAANALAEGRNRFALNIRIPAARGPVWVGGVASFTDRDPGTGRPRALYAVYRDITDIIEARQKREQAEIEIRRADEARAESERMRRLVEDLKTAEARLRESQRFYREVVQAAKLSTWDYDIPNHTITLSDDEHTSINSDILGLPRVIENVPASVADHISPEDRPAFLQMYREVDEGRSAACEAWYVPDNGREPRCERISYIAVDAPDGRPVRAIGFTQNITAEKKVEERYQRELGFLRQTDENNLLAKGHYNLTRNTVLEYTTKNDSVFKVQPGISYDEALAALLDMPYQESERRELAEKLDRRKLIERYQRGDMQTSLVYRRARKGELPIWISMNIHTYTMPETGDLETFTYSYDVSGKMETDEIIGLISDEEFDFIGLIFADCDEIEFIKKSESVGYAGVRERKSYSAGCAYVRRSFVGEDERSAYDEAVAVENILAGLRANNGRHAATYRRTENGRVRCKQLDYVWLDKLSNIILVVRSDVTAAFERDQRQLARIEAARLEADRANEAKSTFLSSMSHDLRTPLNGVLGFTGLALREDDPAKKQEYLEKIDSSGKLLLDLVNDTLELSRIESGKSALEPEAVMPDDLIPAVVTALRPSAELKNITLTEDYPNDKTSPVWCDRLKVQKIVLNLLSNAIKYTPEGGSVSVSLLPAPPEAKGCSWSLCIEDNGIGMSEAFMQRMFEPFAQEKRSESLKTPGTGLGLAIVRRYVDLMGGRIDVVSRLHEGTRWVVSLPICEVPAGSVQKREAAASLRSIAGRRVLLCEDNYMNTEIATTLLKEQNVQVDAAENGELGASRFADSPEGYYDAVLMDMRMPVMDGNAAARKIRALPRADAKSVPIIAMTADAFEESVREAHDAGMNGYVTKPIEPEKLFRTLAELICGEGSAAPDEKSQTEK